MPSKRISRLPAIHNIRADSAYESAIAKFSKEGIQVATIGTPDIPPPQIALDIFARYAADSSQQGYQIPSFGHEEMLKSASEFRNRRHGLKLKSNSLTALKGAREGLHNVLETFTDEGDLIAVPAWHYPGVLNAVVRAYCKPVFYSVAPGTDLTEELQRCFQEAFRVFGRYPRLGVIVPVGNPVGTQITQDSLQSAVDYLNHMKSFILSDEAYVYNPFHGQEIAGLCQVKNGLKNGAALFTFSKLFDWPSSRLAFGQASTENTEYLRRADSAGHYGHHVGIQQAAIELFKEDYDGFSTKVGEIYGQRYDTVFSVCQPRGIKVYEAGAGMFASVELPEAWKRVGSREAAACILEQTGKRINPGVVHGEDADCLLRIALVRDAEILRQIAEGICEVLLKEPHVPNVPGDALTMYTA